ncbi:hypothetical protein CLV42_106324 [Chitinophaga ginsengisoli]|uniref:Uncharacterized protein n=1 Tax=Chitinophaga ginsengisoli TaxID=363837 RepID=A0A2P8G7P5_9BACT|nr:hypothetical protein CLV42_106324 [Chitinophaga ginsengisoli]
MSMSTTTHLTKRNRTPLGVTLVVAPGATRGPYYFYNKMPFISAKATEK